MFSGIILWSVGSVFLALAGLKITKRLVQEIDVHANADFLIAMVTIVGTLVSVVIGLLVSTSVDQYREMESSVDAEASSIANIFRLSRGLPAKPAALLQTMCQDYCEHTVKDEWPSMRAGHASEDVTMLYAKLNDVIVGLHPANAGEANIQASLIDTTKNLGHSRRERIVAVQSNWINRLLPILLLSAGIVMAMSYLYVNSKPSKLDVVLISFVAIALGSNIGVVFMMSRPFSSDWSIAPDQFELNAKYMRMLKDAPLYGSSAH